MGGYDKEEELLWKILFMYIVRCPPVSVLLQYSHLRVFAHTDAGGRPLDAETFPWTWRICLPF